MGCSDRRLLFRTVFSITLCFLVVTLIFYLIVWGQSDFQVIQDQSALAIWRGDCPTSRRDNIGFREKDNCTAHMATLQDTDGLPRGVPHLFFILAIVCLQLDLGLPHWGWDNFCHADSIRAGRVWSAEQNLLKFSAMAGNWTRATESTDSKIHSFSHWAQVYPIQKVTLYMGGLNCAHGNSYCMGGLWPRPLRRLVVLWGVPLL